MKIGVVSYRAPGLSATDRFRYDILVKRLPEYGFEAKYFNPSENYDLTIFPLKNPEMFSIISKKSDYVIADITDDVFSFPDWLNVFGKLNCLLSDWAGYFLGRRYLVKMLKADGLVVGSEEQKNIYQAYVKNVSVITDAVLDSDILRGLNHTNSMENVSRKPIRLVWFGNVESLHGLAEIQPSLDELGKTSGFELHIVTSSGKKFPVTGKWPRSAREFMKHQKIQCVFHEWNTRTYSSVISENDIALVPVCGNYRYTWSKPPGRVLLSMALGLPVVASSIPSYKQVISNGENGFIAENSEDWIRYIRKLAENADSRRRIALAGRQFVMENYNEKMFVGKYAETIKNWVPVT